jgi:cysteine desulfurase/selenocysteine lyase
MPTPEPLIYCDNAATGFPKPAAVVDAMTEFLTHQAVNPGRSGFDLSLATGRMVDAVRGRLDRWFNNPAADPDRAVFTANATGALNLAIQGVVRPGDHVVSTVLEHNSVLRPLTMLQKAGIITFDLAGCDAQGRVDPDAVGKLLRNNTRLVIMTHASNVCGTIQPVAEVGSLCRAREILFLVDAAQSAGLIPVDMTAMQADMVAFTGHKSLLGPPGIGGLIVGPAADIRTTRWGGTGVRSALREHPEDYPWRLEAGTLNTVGIAGLNAGLDWIEAAEQDILLEKERRLADRFLAACAEMEKIEIQGGETTRPTCLGTGRLPVVSVTISGRTPEEIGLFLDTDWNIAVRTGLHCAPLAHQALGTAGHGSVRFSFGPFNTDADIDVIVEAVRDLAR